MKYHEIIRRRIFNIFNFRIKFWGSRIYLARDESVPLEIEICHISLDFGEKFPIPRESIDFPRHPLKFQNNRKTWLKCRRAPQVNKIEPGNLICKVTFNDSMVKAAISKARICPRQTKRYSWKAVTAWLEIFFQYFHKSRIKLCASRKYRYVFFYSALEIAKDTHHFYTFVHGSKKTKSYITNSQQWENYREIKNFHQTSISDALLAVHQSNYVRGIADISK